MGLGGSCLVSNLIVRYLTMVKPRSDRRAVPTTTGRALAPASELEAGSVWSLLDRVARQLRDIHRHTVRHTGLTPAQYVVLRALWRSDRQPPAALAADSRCTRATMTGLVDSLEKRALVRRAPNPDDRRSLLVGLTAKGKSLQRSTPDIDHLFDGCCSVLSAREMRQLRGLLEKVGASLGRLGPAGACHCGGQS